MVTRAPAAHPGPTRLLRTHTLGCLHPTCPLPPLFSQHYTLHKMSGPDGDQFRRFAQQLQRRATSGGMPGGRGALAGGGALAALIGGGILLTSSLFNGITIVVYFGAPGG
jgi:hypothetical protein